MSVALVPHVCRDVLAFSLHQGKKAQTQQKNSTKQRWDNQTGTDQDRSLWGKYLRKRDEAEGQGGMD
jgi:hypothetical protein